MAVLVRDRGLSGDVDHEPVRGGVDRAVVPVVAGDRVGAAEKPELRRRCEVQPHRRQLAAVYEAGEEVRPALVANLVDRIAVGDDDAHLLPGARRVRPAVDRAGRVCACRRGDHDEDEDEQPAAERRGHGPTANHPEL